MRLENIDPNDLLNFRYRIGIAIKVDRYKMSDQLVIRLEARNADGLMRPVESVAGVAETRDDIGMIVNQP